MASKLTEEEIYSLIGLVKDKLTVIGYEGFYKKGNDSRNRHYYLCQCSCGKTTIVERKTLISKTRTTASCGCNLPEQHGYSNHPAYHSYKCMMGRAKNPDPIRHKHYIENHITVCEEWYGKPAEFCKWADENGFEKGLTIDRIDNTKGYYPENCRWATKEEQQNNRGDYNHKLTYEGKTLSIAQWARETGIPEKTIADRDKRGLPIEEVLNTNYRKMPKKNDKVKKKLF